MVNIFYMNQQILMTSDMQYHKKINFYFLRASSLVRINKLLILVLILLKYIFPVISSFINMSRILQAEILKLY